LVNAQVRAYLAHTFKHRHYVRDILTPKVHALGITTRNPFYETDGSTKQKHIQIADEKESKGLKVDYLEVCKMANMTSTTIVTRDLAYIDRTDFTIAYLTDLSKGTSDEIFYTGAIKRRPVFLLCDNPMLCNHPWLVYECRFGKICKTEAELIKALKRRYG
jgi:hypothetical protein